MNWKFPEARDERQSDVFVKYAAIIQPSDFHPLGVRATWDFKLAPTKAKAEAISLLFVRTNAPAQFKVDEKLLAPANAKLSTALHKFDNLWIKLGQAKSDTERVLVFDSFAAKNDPFSSMFDECAAAATGVIGTSDCWNRYTKWTAENPALAKQLSEGKLVAPSKDDAASWKNRVRDYEMIRSTLGKQGFNVASLTVAIA